MSSVLCAKIVDSRIGIDAKALEIDVVIGDHLERLCACGLWNFVLEKRCSLLLISFLAVALSSC